ncbi:Holliday junction branch migration protein RuvA [Patescibacteria group bacterium]|nr:Holliday junction branch migration protein RuvA [Patescibacteria group bacterium]MBU1034378.1 Holliday junction branch migration protein RuvA [Patescibacteria group bacterium]MBU1630060.1 Holliday junction branch migration protein RuvA [Patescibacteria group bacterium]MBU1908076.1 Holliday junction branch migration protein RuvA [Patescibacteria group bacterium]
MIGSLRGKILEVRASSILLEVQGVGYAVSLSLPALAVLQACAEVFLYIHDHVREDVRDLYGFGTAEELDFFRQLIGVSGVGPKAALTILSAGSFQSVKNAVMAGDISMLTSVPGVGTKTAQKVVLELKGRLIEEKETAPQDREVLDALLSLGYNSSQAREALKNLDPSLTDTAERIRFILKNVSK